MPDPKPKTQGVQKIVNVANFDQLSKEEQDKILDKLIDGIDEEAGTETTDDETDQES